MGRFSILSQLAIWLRRLAARVTVIATSTAEDAAIDKGLRWTDQMERAVHDELAHQQAQATIPAVTLERKEDTHLGGTLDIYSQRRPDLLALLCRRRLASG